jgi:hypothetical protein
LFFPTEEWTDPLIDMLSILFNSADDGQMQEHHLLQLLSGIIQWIDPPDAVSQAIEDGKSERSYSYILYTFNHLFCFLQSVIFILIVSVSCLMDAVHFYLSQLSQTLLC